MVECHEGTDGSLIVEPAHAFSHGQLYVALSRCGDPKEVWVLSPEEMVTNRTIVNVVYKQALTKEQRSIPLPSPQSAADATENLDGLVPNNPSDIETAVPWHGYMFEPINSSDDLWNGQLTNTTELIQNGLATDDSMEDWLNFDETYDDSLCYNCDND